MGNHGYPIENHGVPWESHEIALISHLWRPPPVRRSGAGERVAWRARQDDAGVEVEGATGPHLADVCEKVLPVHENVPGRGADREGRRAGRLEDGADIPAPPPHTRP